MLQLKEQTGLAGKDNAYASTLRHAFESAQRYLATVDERHVGVTPQALEAMLQLGGALSDQGEDPESVLAALDEFGSPATMAIMGRRFFGGVIGGSLPVTVAAHWIADAWDQSVASTSCRQCQPVSKRKPLSGSSMSLGCRVLPVEL